MGVLDGKVAIVIGGPQKASGPPVQLGWEKQAHQSS